ncbi:SAM-dependent methyltransferase [Marinigracilibium pacificum]|uniref:SAM-dependent methyltransferase n=1 Tax=Marinigracilibium pacificum TaxID=2729599 RepID=A0A848IZ47_9BACT|nr:SAM-dependent methyltransferase [Marinigracilibium pacificum]NMM49803.1 SAM-dependent methyltransferase [Marinigracilibium pacificum]
MESKGTLYLLPLPIAENTLEKSVSTYERNVIISLKYFIVENIRTSRRFISSLREGITIEDLQFFEINKKTDERAISPVIKLLKEGHSVGIMSEAGCPGIADPGAMVADLAHKNNIRVEPLSGPSSMFLALMSSGFNGQKFEFCGYIPVKNPDRRKALLKMEGKASNENVTQIFMDTPYRNNQLLKDIINNCNPNSYLSISCDLTGESEFIKTMQIKNWQKTEVDLHKKPALFLFGRCL